MIWFLIRTAFWLSLVLLILPIGGGGPAEDQVGPLRALNAARSALYDMAGICERRPDVCATGRAALETIGARAREGARMAQDFLETDAGDDAAQAGEDGEPAPEKPVSTGSIEAREDAPAQ